MSLSIAIAIIGAALILDIAFTKIANALYSIAEKLEKK